MEIYFDNSATTRCSDQVCDTVIQTMKEDYGNPSSAHFKGMQAENILKKSREDIAATLHCSEKEIFFTSGGTESDNWAIRGCAEMNRRRGMHLITTQIEHAAVLQTMMKMEKEGFRVTYLPVDEKGLVRKQELLDALDPETIFVSIMAVNNESGTAEPVAELAEAVKSYDSRIIFHTDAVQAYGKIPLRPAKMNIDLMSVSGHKLHGPKGTGFLYIREGTRIAPFILGGGQQKGMRSGTDNVPGAAGLACAAREICSDISGQDQYLRSLCRRLREGLDEMEGIVINTPMEASLSAPHILSISFLGVRSEVMLHALEEKGICVSAGSACSTNKKLPVSSVLMSMHLPREQAESTIRFSFSSMNTLQEVDEALAVIREILPRLRKYSRK